MPPVGFAPAYEALLPGRRLFLSPSKTYGQLNRGHLMGPGASLQQTVFVPEAVNTQNVRPPICFLLHNQPAGFHDNFSGSFMFFADVVLRFKADFFLEYAI